MTRNHEGSTGVRDYYKGLDWPGPLLHDPIYPALKALGPQVRDFLSEIFHRKDESLSSPTDEYPALFSLLNEVTSTQPDFSTRRFCLPPGEASGVVLQVRSEDLMFHRNMRQDFSVSFDERAMQSIFMKYTKDILSYIELAVARFYCW